MRVVSLLASATETVCELGAGDTLVGRSHECDHPAWVQRLPSLSRPSFDITGSSADIDRRVRERLATGAPLYEVDERALAALAPDVLLTQTHCEVCAVTPGNLAPELCRQPVAALETGTLQGILDGFVEVARVLGVEDRGAALALRCRATLEAVRDRARALPRARVACLEWIDPVFAMGNWGPELVEAAGGEAVLGRPGAHSSTTPWEAVVNEDPDVIVMAACGFAIERTASEMHVMEARPGWSDLRAVRQGRVFVADGNRFFNRSGPSAFETAEVLAEILHPTSFEARHEGRDWRLWR
ncbi:MAG: ABC transporter substrate-binding protein [Polyangiaceae bacterium]|jgi:iron complex transport system substrate-binding protein